VAQRHRFSNLSFLELFRFTLKAIRSLLKVQVGRIPLAGIKFLPFHGDLFLYFYPPFLFLFFEGRSFWSFVFVFLEPNFARNGWEEQQRNPIANRGKSRLDFSAVLKQTKQQKN